MGHGETAGEGGWPKDDRRQPYLSRYLTAYLEHGGLLERAKQMANHASTKTTQYDRRNDRTTLDDVERVILS